jgi:dipeptidyl aminopeptidase/acylaminoacyl peptidase
VYTRHFESVNIWGFRPGDRSPARPLISSPHWSYEPAYSPDGKRIAFVSDRTGFGEIWVADADGRNVQQWTSMKQSRLGSPRWSPDTRRIAFTAPGDRGSSIYLIDAPGAVPRLVRGSDRCGYLAWSPDGRAIYYSSDRSGNAQIWKIPPEGGSPTQVTTQGGRVPGIPPGGSHLFYLRVGGPGENHLYRVPLSGGASEKVLEFVDAYSLAQTGVAFKYYRPGLSPIGPFLQFFSFATGTTERLPEPPKPLRYGVAISPDGDFLVYSQADYQTSELMVVENFR